MYLEVCVTEGHGGVSRRSVVRGITRHHIQGKGCVDHGIDACLDMVVNTVPGQCGVPDACLVAEPVGNGLDLARRSVDTTALVEIDENGVTGAAYTQIDLCGGAPRPEDEIDFILDRPFMFTITGRDGSILFAGIVRNID